MKLTKFLVFSCLSLSFLAISVSAQKDYKDPTKRQKRGLLEEPLEEKEEAVTPEPAKKEQSGLTSKQQRLCKCKKLSVLAVKTQNRYRKETNDGALEHDYPTWSRLDREKRKALNMVKILRNRYDLEDFECPYEQITMVKYKHLKKALKAQRPLCDLDML